MAGRRMAGTLGTIKTVFGEGAFSGLPDGELLGRYLAGRDEGAELAFEVLVARHGPMVFRICRRMLRDPHDAEDAAQATFLILARRAGSVRDSGSVASWLFGVASRVSAHARADAMRRRQVEARWAERPWRAGTGEAGAEPSREAWEGLYEEIERLPGRYSRPIVLFHLEGLSYEEAARRLDCSVRTFQTRLARGRERLRGRLARRGLDPSAGLFAAAPRPDAPPAGWAERTARAAAQYAAGPETAAGMVPASVVALAEGVSNVMMLPNLKVAAASLLVAGLLVVGASGLTIRVERVESRDSVTRPPAPSSPEVFAVALADGPPAKGEEPRELKLDDGKSAGMKSIAGGGHAVRFESPGPGWKLTGVRLYGSRYGYPKAPAEDFEVYLCDETFQKLATFPFPYSTFRRGDPKWVTMEVKPTPVPPKFIVSVGFNPTQTKGVYVHHDAAGGKTSLTGLPDEGEGEPFSKGDWMIRARLAPPEEKPAPKPRG